MRHSLLAIALLGVFLTACGKMTSTEEARNRCEEFAWEGEKRDCYLELAIEECDSDHCALIDNETLQSSCARAVERACE